MNNIYIIVLNFNGEKETKECLNSLSKVSFDGVGLNTIVVDNNSQPPLDIDLSKYENLNLEIIRNQKNLGFSGGMNVGIKKALQERADYVLILNNDTLVDSNFLMPLYAVLSDNKTAGIAVPKIYYAKGYEFHKNRYKKEDLGKVIWYAGGRVDPKTVYGENFGVDEVDRGQFDKEKEIEASTGCCMLVKREVFEKIGFFNENYFLYYEDADLSFRAREAGYKIFFVPNSVVWHKNAQSSGGSGSSLQDYYITRNRLYYGMHHVPTRTRAHLLKESIKFALQGRPWQKKAVLDYYSGRMEKGSYS